MKTGRSIVELATELERQRLTKRDFLASTDQLEFKAIEGEGIKLFGLPNIDPVPLTDYAHGQVAAETKVPKQYYDKCREEYPEGLAAHITYWLKKDPRKRMVRTLDGWGRAYMSDRYRPLDNADLAEVALPILVDLGVEIDSCEVTDRRLYIKGVLPSMSREITGSVRKGDIVAAGIVISNSEIGAGALRVEDFFKFLSCTNGMISTSTFKKFHLGRSYDEEKVRELLTSETKKQSDKTFWMTVRDVVTNAFDEASFSVMVDKMTLSTQEKLTGDVTKAVEKVTEIYTLNESTGSNVLRHLIEGGDLSRWGLINAVTRSAEDEESYDVATEIERVGGKILELAPTEWKVFAEAA